MHRSPVSPRTSQYQDSLIFWAFTDRLLSSLAMAEMTTLMAAIYRTYSTTIKPGYEGVSPGVTSRFEVFFDENFTQIEVSGDVNFLPRCAKANIDMCRNMHAGLISTSGREKTRILGLGGILLHNTYLALQRLLIFTYVKYPSSATVYQSHLTLSQYKLRILHNISLSKRVSRTCPLEISTPRRFLNR